MISAVLAAALLAPNASPAVPRVGIVADPCAALAPMPAVLAENAKRAAAAKAAGATPPPSTAAETKIYLDWQDALKREDFFGLCHYRAANSSLPPASNYRVILFGDSITELWHDKDPTLFTNDWLDRGVSGQTTEQMLGRFRADVIALKPAVVQIIAGTNDIAGNTGPTTLHAIENNIASMVELAKVHGIRVVIGATPPAAAFGWRAGIDPRSAIAELNSWLSAYSKREGLTFIDYYDALKTGSGAFDPMLTIDGVHPNAAGYAQMRKLLTQQIKPVTG